jgi:hypothetical protein
MHVLFTENFGSHQARRPAADYCNGFQVGGHGRDYTQRGRELRFFEEGKAHNVTVGVL